MKKIILTLASAAMLWGCAAQAQEAPPAATPAPAAPAAAPAPAISSRVMMLRVTVADSERAANFYRDVFGAVAMQGMMGPPPASGEASRGGGIRIMTLPGGLPGLILIPGDEDENSSWVMQVSDLPGTLQRAQANGATLMNTHFEAGQGGFAAQAGPAQSTHIVDPDGNVIELLQMGGAR